MGYREIITFQLGNYANYVGTHWWNTQETGFSYKTPNDAPCEINHDILFREGKNYRGYTTFTPRVLMVDCKGALQHLPEGGGSLYQDPSQLFYSLRGDEIEERDLDELKTEEVLNWDPAAQLAVDQADPIEMHPYQKCLEKFTPSPKDLIQNYNFSETVQTWTDYMSSRYHPRSINIIGSLTQSAQEAPLDTFSCGEALWKTDQFEDDFADRIRQYIEECNLCQGFQMIFDGDDGFSGLASRTLTHVNDEYSKTVIAVPVFAPNPRPFKQADAAMTDSIRVVNMAMSYANMIEDQAAALIVPLSTVSKVWRRSWGRRELPLFEYKSENLYETSAVLAAYLDTISLDYRRKEQASNLSSFCASVNNYGRRLVGTGLALPFLFKSDEYLINSLDNLELESLFTQMSPNTKMGTDKIVQHVSVRGIPDGRIKKPLNEAGDQIRMSAYNCNTTSDMLSLYFQCNMYASLTHVASISAGLPLRTPFPMELFDDRVRNDNGLFDDFLGTSEDWKSSQVPVMAAIQTSCDLADTIESLHREAARVKLAKIPRFAESGMESDMFVEALERLLEFADNYTDAFQL